MYLPRKKCRILLTWIILATFAQLLVYALLFGEVKLKNVQRKTTKNGLTMRLDLGNSHGHFPGDARGIKTIRDTNIQKSADLTDPRVEHLENIKELQALPSQLTFTTSSTVSKPKTDNIKIQGTRSKTATSTKQDKDLNVEFVPVDRRLTGPSDIFVSVKTTLLYHASRVQEIIQTWLSLMREQVYLFTDADDPHLNKTLGGHLVNTKCNSGHQRSALCCKMQAELNYFWEKAKERWFCHFDDDNYVNFPSLIKLLRQYNHHESVYLGKTSILSQMQAWDRHEYKEIKFWFATGGAGICLSRNLVSRMLPYFRNNAFVQTCERIGLPDDCTLGFIIESLLGVQLIKSYLFHSHLEGLQYIMEHELRDQVTLSHGYLGSFYNCINIKGPFSQDDDPSRFKSLHCFLNPGTSWCPHPTTTQLNTDTT